MLSNGMSFPSVEDATAQLEAALALRKAGRPVSEALGRLRAKVEGAVQGVSKEMAQNPTTGKGVLNEYGVESITARIMKRVVATGGDQVCFNEDTRKVTVERGTGTITICIEGTGKAITDGDIDNDGQGTG